MRRGLPTAMRLRAAGPLGERETARLGTLVKQAEGRPKKPPKPRPVDEPWIDDGVCCSLIALHSFDTVQDAAEWLYVEADEFFLSIPSWVLALPSRQFVQAIQELADQPGTGLDGILLMQEEFGWTVADSRHEVERLVGKLRFVVVSFEGFQGLLDVLEHTIGPACEIVMLCCADDLSATTKAYLDDLYERFLFRHMHRVPPAVLLSLLELWDENQNVPIPVSTDRMLVYDHPVPRIFRPCDPTATIYFGLRRLPNYLQDRAMLFFPDAAVYLKDHSAGELYQELREHLFRPPCANCGGLLLKWEAKGLCCRGLANPAAAVAAFPKGPPSDLADLIMECTRRDASFARKLNLSLSPVVRNASIGGSRPGSALTRLQGCPYAYDPGPTGNRILHFLWSPLQSRMRSEEDIDSRLVALITKARALATNPKLQRFATLAEAHPAGLPELIVGYAREEVDLNTVTIAIANHQALWAEPSVVVGIARETSERIDIRSYTTLYDQMVYPLLFFDGHGGFGNDEEVPGTLAKKFKCFLFQPREDSFAHQSGLLMEELIADTYGRYFDNKLTYAYTHIRNLVSERDLRHPENPEFGRRLFIPASVPGSRAYFQKLNYDAAALTLRLGNCTWFLTITCNPKWLEMASLGVDDYALRSFDVVRVFKMRVQMLMQVLKSNHLLGTIKGYLYRYEYQNRGLPHVHILLWTDVDVDDPAIVDEYVCAELPPDDGTDTTRVWRQLIQKFQIHNHSSRCGYPTTGFCCYNYPRPVNPVTVPTGRRIKLRRRKPEDRLVVPYNPILTNLLRCHTDVEPVSSSQCPAYTLKYTSKDSGHSDLTAHRDAMYHGQPVDDDFHYWMATKVTGTAECVMELLNSDRYSLSPTVIVLSIHLPDGGYRAKT